MKINIYYGGRGLINDPTSFVIKKMQEVLEELNVTVERYNLCDMKNNIITLPRTLKDVDGIILASTVEWYGVGGYMQQFLDACWLYGDKEQISHIYMCPVVMSTTYGERDGKLTLCTAWEILGGKPCSGICGYIKDTVALEMNEDYIHLIEKKAENMYRTIHQKMVSLPASNQAVKQVISVTQNTDLTPQESEQLSQYAADDIYVQRQKEDIQELASMFRDMMGTTPDRSDKDDILDEFQKVYKPQGGLDATYVIHIEERSMPLVIKVNNGKMECTYGNGDAPDVEFHIEKSVLNDVFRGRMTFQRAFMTGEIKKMKGDFKVLRALDQIFPFVDLVN